MPHRLPAHLGAALVAAVFLAACSKDEPAAPAKPKVATSAPAPSPAPSAQSPAEVDAALKERLARQEAAAKMFDRKPDAPKAVEAPKAEAPRPEEKAPEPAKAAPAKPAPAATPKPAEPPPAAAKAPEVRAPAKAETRASEPPKVASAPPSAPAVTAPTPAAPAPAAPATPSPAAAAAAPRVVARVDPEFPREAVQAGADRGSVKARMTLDASGNVTRVEILEANPRRVFDRAVTRALTQWRFDDGAAGRTVETEVAFHR